MNLKLPEFAEGIHYEELRGSDPHSNGRYRFRLLQDVSIRVPCLVDRTGDVISFRSRDGREWAQCADGVLTVRWGYAWNGASPKKWCLGRWWGTPDFEKTRLATLFHDVCFQFLRVRDWPMGIHECNRLFYSVMEQQDFKLANTYFGAVTDFGEMFAGKHPLQGEHSVII